MPLRRQLVNTAMACLSLLVCSGAATPQVMIEKETDAFRVVRLPMGAPLQILLQTPIDTGTNQPQDEIHAILAPPIYLGDSILLSGNTRFEGKISVLERPLQGRNALLAVSFHEIILEDGERLPIEAHIKTQRPDHVWGGELTPGTQPDVVIHKVAGIGMYGQAIFRGPRVMGTHIQLLPGERWTLILDKPLTLYLPKQASP